MLKSLFENVRHTLAQSQMKDGKKKQRDTTPKVRDEEGHKQNTLVAYLLQPAQNYFAYGDVNNTLASWQLMPGSTVSPLVPCGFSYPTVFTTVFKPD